MAGIDRGFHRVSLAECLKTGINVTKPLAFVSHDVSRVVSHKSRKSEVREGSLS